MPGKIIDDLFIDGQLSAITFETTVASFAIPLEQVLYIEKDVKRHIQVGELVDFNHEVITFQNKSVQLYDFNKLIGTVSHQQLISSMLKELESMSGHHKKWLDDIETTLKENTPFTQNLDADKCIFGLWYNNFKTEDEELLDILKRLDQPHKTLHQTAKKILSTYQSEPEQSLAMLAQLRQNVLPEILSLTQLMRERALSSIRPIIIFVEHIQGRITALRLDKINDILTFTKSQFNHDDSNEGIFKNRDLDFKIEGFLRDGENAPLMLINCQPRQTD